ncbi:MAG: type VI secretion system contractile sheath large subunit [Syntrophorhabdaceae bacterium]|nr:type VI secretion system contractile sheath large subunit [Syntrophorhabdaceae bacterium]
MDIPYKPFTILAIGPFAPIPLGPYQVKMVPVDTPNEALCLLRPALWVPVPTEICPEGGVTVSPEKIRDLTPDGMLESAGYARDLSDAREFIRRSASGGTSPGAIADEVRGRWPHLPLDLSFQAQPAKPAARSRVDDILSMVATGAQPAATALVDGGPVAWIAAIDTLLGKLLAAVYSDDIFRALEASWRGIELVVKQGPAGSAKETRLSLVNASRENLADAFDQLANALETDPPDLVLIDLPFDNSPLSMELVEKAAAFAEGIIAPTVVTAAAAFLGLHDWTELDRLPYLRHHVEDNPVYAKWNKLRSLPEANWLVAACNGFLARSPYGSQSTPRDVSFEEASMPWINPVWALGTLAAQSTASFGWPSRLTDGENIRLEGLGLHAFENGSQASTEAVFSVDRLRQFGQIGLTPVAGISMKDIAFMPSALSVSGESLAFQMFFSRLTGFLIRLREDRGASPSDEGEVLIEQALEAFFRRSGGHLPGDLSVKGSVEGGRLSFEIALTPPAAIVPDSRRITFTFAW